MPYTIWTFRTICDLKVTTSWSFILQSLRLFGFLVLKKRDKKSVRTFLLCKCMYTNPVHFALDIWKNFSQWQMAIVLFLHLCYIAAGAAVMVHVPSNPYNRQVSDTLLHDLVEDLSTSWKMLGRRLGIPEGAITNIDMERRRVVEKGMAMFAEWKRRKGEGATVGVLREALDKTGRRDLSERVRGTVNLTFAWFS